MLGDMGRKGTEYANRHNHAEKEQAVGRKYDGTAWWPLFALMGILGGLLLWEEVNPLPLLSAQAVSFATLALLSGGIGLWLILFAKE
jgi:hypothetical protein